MDLNQCSWCLKYFHGFVPVLATIDKSFQQFFYDKPFLFDSAACTDMGSEEGGSGHMLGAGGSDRGPAEGIGLSQGPPLQGQRHFHVSLYNLSKLRIHSGQSVTAGTFAAHKSEGVQSRLENWSAEGSQRALRVRLESDSEWRPCAKRRPKRCSLSYLLTLLRERAKYFYRSSRSLRD